MGLSVFGRFRSKGPVRAGAAFYLQGSEVLPLADGEEAVR